MDIERFHNELAMLLGYERIVKNRNVMVSVEESDDPVVTLKIQGCDDIRFKASEYAEYSELENQYEIKVIVDAAHQAYRVASNYRF